MITTTLTEIGETENNNSLFAASDACHSALSLPAGFQICLFLLIIGILCQAQPTSVMTQKLFISKNEHFLRCPKIRDTSKIQILPT